MRPVVDRHQADCRGKWAVDLDVCREEQPAFESIQGRSQGPATPALRPSITRIVGGEGRAHGG